MSRVLVTGGKGVLGRQLVPLLVDAGHQVTITSRTPHARTDGVAEMELDLITGRGLEAAVAGQQVIVHAASDARRPKRVDQLGTERLVAAAYAAGAEHLVYISIVGVDVHPLRYYRAKLAAEQAIAASGVPFSILRATQFHDLVRRFVDEQRRLPVVFVPKGVEFQVIETAAVAARVVRLVAAGPSGRVPDVGGPEALPAVGLARDYLRASGRRRTVIGFRLPGATGRAFRGSANLTPNVATESTTWREYLATLTAEERAQDRAVS